MNYEIVTADVKDKDKLYRLLQYALYDGSQYIDNDINEECIFEYRWFDNYFTDSDRNAYFIKNGEDYLGMVLVNENLKFNNDGKCIAEFLIMPRFRRNHIGKKLHMIYLKCLKAIGKFNQWRIILLHTRFGKI